MRIDAAHWKTVSTLFDELVDLDEAQRQKQLAQLKLDPPTSTWLKQLLAAHDSADAHVLDQTVDRFAANLAGVDTPDFGELTAEFAGQRLGNWLIGEPIGHGAMATVFHAQRADGAYEQHVAIKLLQPGADQSGDRDRLQEELRVLARLEHPGIARLIDGGLSDQGWPYLVMEYVDGAHIDQWCAEQDLDWRQRIELVIKVCDAVRYAHGKLVVHADIKPSNVLVSRSGEPKLVDFGIAGLLREEREAAGDDRAMLLRCSPAYAAPEQLRGLAVNTATDVFGVGALLYQLLVGTPIRSGQTLTRLLLDPADSEPIVPPSEHPSPLVPINRLRGDIDAICRRALAGDPAMRYASIDPLQQDLRDHLRHVPVSARAQSKPYLLSRWLYRHRLGASLGFMLLLSLLAGLTVSIQQTQLANESAQRAEATTAFLLSVFEADNPSDFESPLQTTRRDLAERAAVQLELNFDNSQEDALRLSIAVARVLRRVGLTDQARPLLERAINAAEAGGSGASRPELIEAWFELGQIESLEERMVPAGEALQRADALATEAGQSPVERAAILFQLGRAQSASRQYQAALATLNEAARLADQSEDTRLLVPRIELLAALTLNRAGQTQAALLTGQRAVAGARDRFGPDHDRTASALSTVGGMLRVAGELDRAELMLREAYDIGVRNYGQPNPAAANNLALLLETLGHLVEAESLQTEALNLAEAYYGPASAASARYRRNLAMIQTWQGDWQRALPNLRRAVAIHEADTSGDDPYSVFMVTQLAWSQRRASNSEAALATLPALLRELPRMTEAYPRGALWIHMLAAELALDNDDTSLALQHSEAMNALLTGSGAPVANSERVYVHLIAALAASAQAVESSTAELWQALRSESQRLLGPDHPLRRRVEQEAAARSRLASAQDVMP